MCTSTISGIRIANSPITLRSLFVQYIISTLRYPTFEPKTEIDDRSILAFSRLWPKKIDYVTRRPQIQLNGTVDQNAIFSDFFSSQSTVCIFFRTRVWCLYPSCSCGPVRHFQQQFQRTPVTIALSVLGTGTVNAARRARPPIKN